jgi:hypothetical protein
MLEGKSNEIQYLKKQLNENSATVNKLVKYLELTYRWSNSPLGSEENRVQERELSELAKDFKDNRIIDTEYL